VTEVAKLWVKCKNSRKAQNCFWDKALNDYQDGPSLKDRSQDGKKTTSPHLPFGMEKINDSWETPMFLICIGVMTI